MKARIGYLVPEFPGQTHTWIWRDRRALAELGIQADLVSTRRPKLIVHAWAEQAQQLTHYLVPLSARDVRATVGALLKAGPKALARCLLVPLEIKGLSTKQRLRMAALIVIAGRFAALARERGWTQLHVLSAGDAAHVAAFASYLTGIDYSLTLLAPLEGYGPNQREKWQDASFALVMSEKLLSDVHQNLGDVAPDKIAIAPMGVDVDQAKRALPYQPWRPGKPCRIYTCGRLHPVKGHKFLFEAAALLASRGYPIEVQVAGGEEGVAGGGYKDGLVQQLRQLGIEKSVEFLGAVTEERHRQGIQEAHVFVLASLDEGISVAAMEAMAMQTPAVVTDVGGMRELVTPESDALMVPSQNPQALADAIARILDSPEFALRLSEQSREKVVRKFHHRRSAEALAECLGVIDARA
ncbi:MAG TPA: exopolysaccharide biosynthesis GT4 family glycosyltransferase EpsE [Polyangiaceae bacterium]|nr:exopolysaccharide biosynthesis GT4 family glycosyltransferase EpsE [Polyangiaceae bacterium]